MYILSAVGFKKRLSHILASKSKLLYRSRSEKYYSIKMRLKKYGALNGPSRPAAGRTSEKYGSPHERSNLCSKNCESKLKKIREPFARLDEYMHTRNEQLTDVMEQADLKWD